MPHMNTLPVVARTPGVFFSHGLVIPCTALFRGQSENFCYYTLPYKDYNIAYIYPSLCYFFRLYIYFYLQTLICCSRSEFEIIHILMDQKLIKKRFISLH